MPCPGFSAKIISCKKSPPHHFIKCMREPSHDETLAIGTLIKYHLIPPSIKRPFVMPKTISAAELSEIKNPLFLDVRQNHETIGGHIDGALLIPLHELDLRINEIDLSRNIVAYCRANSKAATACEILAHYGARNIAILADGYHSANAALIARMA